MGLKLDFKSKLYLKWLPIVLGFMYGIFFCLFALEESFPSIAFFMQLLPGLLILIFTFVCMRYRKYAIYIFSALGFVSLFFYKTFNDIEFMMLLTLPFFVIGGLFYLDYYLNKQ